MNSSIANLSTGMVTCMLFAIYINILTNRCSAHPMSSNEGALKIAKLKQQQEDPKPLVITKEDSKSDLEFPITNVILENDGLSSVGEKRQPPLQTSQIQTGLDGNTTNFPDRRGFFTGHRIPLELFSDETLRHIELTEETKNIKANQGLQRVPPGYPRRIPLELFSEESLRRIDGLDNEEEPDNYPRRVPIELFSDESLKRLDLLDEKEDDPEESVTTVNAATVKAYVDSDSIRESHLKRVPKRLYVHGGVNDDPEAAAHHFPALSISGEGDPTFLDTLVSFYNE